MGFLTKVLSTAADDDFTLACDLIAIAYADGKLTEEEKKTICRICQLEKVEDELYTNLFTDSRQVNVHMPETLKAKEDYLIKMIQVMGADAESSPEEIFLLEIMADRLGFNKMQLLSIVLLNATRKHFPGDIGSKVINSYLRHTIDVRGKNAIQNRQNIAALYDSIASYTPSSQDEEEDKRLLKEALTKATQMFMENKIQQEEFRRAGLDFKDFLESEAEKAYKKWTNY